MHFILIFGAIIAIGSLIQNKRPDKNGSGLPQSKENFVEYTPNDTQSDEDHEVPEIRSPG